MAQIASGGGWETTLTLVNVSSATAQAQVNFYDNSGQPATLPFTYPQQSASGTSQLSTVDASLSSGASLLLDTASLAQTSVAGSAQVLSDVYRSIDGFAIFKYLPTNQQAAVPLETSPTAAYILPFDNTGTLGTGLAIARLDASAGSVGVVVRDDTGVVIPTHVSAIPLAASGHASFMLTDPSLGFPETAGKRGTIYLIPPFGAGNGISVLGLRTNSGALTTLPSHLGWGNLGATFAHIASGGGWQTTLTLVNQASFAATATLRFCDDNGDGLAVPLNLPQSGENLTSSQITRSLPPYATLIVATQGPSSGPTLTGSAQLTTSGVVGGMAVFRYAPSGQEAVVPLESRTPAGFLLAFDNTGGVATGVALSNSSAVSAAIPVTLRDDAGKTIATATVGLSPNGHTSFMLTDAKLGFPATAGQRGTVEFDVPSGAFLAVVGIRAQDQVITTIPSLQLLTKIPSAQ